MSALLDAAGAKLDTLVEAQRGMSDVEAYRFLRTGELPDLSQPPEDPLADAVTAARETPVDAQVIPLDVARRVLDGDAVALTASSFFADGTLHGEPWNGDVTSRLWATDDLTAAGRWKPQDHPRDRNGRFIEKGAVSGLLSAKKPVLADLRNAVAELDQKQWNNLTGAQQAHIAERVEKIPESTELGQQLRQKLGSLGAPKIEPELTQAQALKTGKKVVPAVIYKKHADGAVVAQRGERRLRWDAGAKKFAADERENGEWVEKQQLTKTAAYAEMKNGDWREPSAPVDNVPPAAVEPTPIDIVTTPVTPKPSPSTTQTDALTRYVNSSYARRADGAWVEVNEKTGKITNVDSSTSKALDANVKSGLMVPESPSASKLTVEPPPVRPDGVPLPDTNRFKKLTDQDAVNIHAQMQAPKWTAAQAQALNFYASDGHKTMNPALRGDVVPDGKTKKAIADARAGMRPLPRDVLVFRGTTYAQFGATGDNDMRKKIGEVFHDPAFISTSTSPYQDFVKNAPLRIEIEVPKGTPAAYVAAVSNNPSERELLLAPDQYLQLLDVRDTSLGTVSVLRVVPKPKNDTSATNSGQTNTNLPAPASSETPEPAPTGSQPTAKINVVPSIKIPSTLNQALVDEYVKLAAKHAIHAQMYVTSAPKLTYEENMRMYNLNVEIGEQSDSTVRDRIDQLGRIEGALTAWRRDHGVFKKSPDALKKQLADEVREQFADKKIGLRVTASALAAIVNSGRVKTQFETSTSSGWNDPSYRAKFEAQWFGIGQGLSLDDAVKVEPEKRPVYGYVMLDGVRPAGDVDSDRLSAYGSIQVVLKDNVRKRTTAMFGDSINDHRYGMPSPVDNPSWESFTPQPGYVPGAVASTSPLTQRTRDPNSDAFRKHTYAEAQVHGGVTIDDIDEVVFPTKPSTAEMKMLKTAGIKWRVVKSGTST